MLTPSFQNLLSSSFLLWFNNIFFTKSQAITNVSTQFYPINNVSGYQGVTINGLYTYAPPIGNQFISDWSIPNANVLTGLYLNGNYITTGVSGFVDINYDKGVVYFNQPLPTNSILSGNFTVKDFNIQLTSDPEETLLFQNQYVLNPTVSQTINPHPIDSVSYPCIFIKNKPLNNVPFAFGGENETNSNITCFLFMDSSYNLDGAISYINDFFEEYVPFLKQNEFPYDYLGGVIGTGFSYQAQVAHKIVNGSGILIKKVDVSRFDKTDFKQQNPNLFFATVDLKLSSYRYPRFNPQGLSQFE